MARRQALVTSVRHRVGLIRHGRRPLGLADRVGQLARLGAGEVGVDVFDTVLVRRLVGEAAAERAAAAAVIGAGLWPAGAGELLEARRSAEASSPSAPLRAWLRDPALQLLGDPERAYEVEAAVEQELVVAVPGAAEALAALREGRRLVFVSDMHLDASTIRQLLLANGVAEPADEVLVSCETGSSKSGGGLYPVAFPATGPGVRGRRRRPVFIGNNPWADVTRASGAGLRPLPALVANPTDLEQLMASRPGTLGPAIAGAARLVRLGQGSPGEPDGAGEGSPEDPLLANPSGQGHSGRTDHAMRALGAATIGQMMAAFLFWVIGRCQERDLGEVRFVARDGRLPYEMARRLPADHWQGIGLGYLRAGRGPWTLAAADAVGIEPWVAMGTRDRHGFLLHAADRVPFTSTLARCGLQPDDLPARSALARRDPSAPLSGDEIDQWIDVLRSGDIDKAILEAAAEPHRLVRAHLDSAVPAGRPLALVDVGWRGQQAWLISSLLQEATGHEPTHFHVGGDGVQPEIDALVDIERFALDDQVRPHPLRGSVVTCLELFLGNGEPRLVGYQPRAGGGVEEVLERSSTSVSNRSQRLLAAGACDLAGLLPTRAECSRWGLSDTPLDGEVRNLLARIWDRPTSAEATLLARLHFEHDDRAQLISPAVVPYSLAELAGRANPVRTWREGSLAATSPWLRSALQAALTFGDIAKSRMRRTI